MTGAGMESRHFFLSYAPHRMDPVFIVVSGCLFLVDSWKHLEQSGYVLMEIHSLIAILINK
jgi:hypothetical protein